MKAFQVRAPFEFGLAQVDRPEVAPGEVQVDVAYAGICGSDMHIIHGQNAFVRFPGSPAMSFPG